MALTTFQPTLPAVAPLTAIPADVNLQWAAAQTIAATGYLNNVNTQLDIGAGRTGFFAVVDLTAQAGTTPNFQFHVFGSNDVAFGNGNVEDLMEFDYAPATAQRLVPTIVGGSIAVPDPGRVGSLIIKPFWNLGQGMITYRYLRLYVVMTGAGASLTMSAWAAPWEMYYG
jgi:hypothetical protein